MSTPRIAVAIDPAVPAGAAVRWAAREAARRGAHLHIVLPDDHRRDLRCRHAFATAVSAARHAAPGVVLTADAADGSPVPTELAASAEADLLVLAGPAPHVDELVMSAFCPLVVVPDRPLPRPGPRGGLPLHSGITLPVVLGVGPATEPEVLAFAFAEAQARRAGLIAVRTWTDPLVDLGLLLPDRIARWDAADQRVRDDLAQQLSLCTLAYPDVEVERLVVNDRCAELLAAVALHARLLVLGRPARGALLNGVAASPAATLARHVPCPVVIVPPAEHALPAWLPTRRVGLADLRP